MVTSTSLFSTRFLSRVSSRRSQLSALSPLISRSSLRFEIEVCFFSFKERRVEPFLFCEALYGVFQYPAVSCKMIDHLNLQREERASR